jgi:hypothetical protein
MGAPINGHLEHAMRKIMPILSILAFAASARAGGYCYYETVTAVVMFNNAVYFTTSHSCPSWCLVPQTWSAAAQSQAFATLLTARTTGQTITTYWADQPSDNSCPNTEAVSSSPDRFVL